MDLSTTSSRSRRSYPNLPNLSLAPLSSQFPIDGSTLPSPSEYLSQAPRTSYITQKSAPTTPGILNLSQSRSDLPSRPRPNKGFAYDGFFFCPEVAAPNGEPITKTKSMSAFENSSKQPYKRHHQRKATAPLPGQTTSVRCYPGERSSEWFHRAGITIAGETREAKGQGWLIRHASSTSHLSQAEEHDESSHYAQRMALLSGEYCNDNLSVTFTPRDSRICSRFPSRTASRTPSRMHSTQTSRKGSRAGSRQDLLMTSAGQSHSHYSPAAARRHSLDLELDESMFETHSQPTETGAEFMHLNDEDAVSFLDDDASIDADEQEIAQLARDRGFGLGGWMDRLIGWTLFSVDEEDAMSSASESSSFFSEGTEPLRRREDMTREEAQLMRDVFAKRKKMEREAIIAAAAVRMEEKPELLDYSAATEKKQVQEVERNHVWTADAAWLLGVAAKVVL